MNKLKFGLFILLALMLVLTPLLSGCAKEEEPTPPPPPEEEAPPPPEPIVIRFTSVWPPVDDTIMAMKELDTIIPEATNGLVKFEQYHGGQLYGYVEGYMAVQSGDIEMCWGGTELGPISPEWDAICALSWLCDDEAHFLRLMETDAGKALLDRMEAMGLKHITYLGFAGTGNICNNKHAVEKLEDFKGVKFWFPPFPKFLAQAEALGIQTVAMDPAEWNTALEMGMVDGCIASDAGTVAWNLKEVCPYMTRAGIGFAAPYMVVNTTFWNSLPPDIQQTLQSVFDEWAQRHQTFLRERHERVIADFEAAGGVVITITGAEKDRWLEALKPVYDQAMEAPNVAEIIEAANATR